MFVCSLHVFATSMKSDPIFSDIYSSYQSTSTSTFHPGILRRKTVADSTPLKPSIRTRGWQRKNTTISIAPLSHRSQASEGFSRVLIHVRKICEEAVVFLRVRRLNFDFYRCRYWRLYLSLTRVLQHCLHFLNWWRVWSRSKTLRGDIFCLLTPIKIKMDPDGFFLSPDDAHQKNGWQYFNVRKTNIKFLQANQGENHGYETYWRVLLNE